LVEKSATSHEQGNAAAKAMAFESGPGAFPLLGSDLLARRGRVLDLTRPLFEGMPQWFGHQKTFISVNQDHEGFRRIWKTDPGFAARNLFMSEHVGTHTDAIFEYDPDGPTLDQTPLQYYWGEAVALDVSEVEFVDPDPTGKGYADESVIRRAEERLEAQGESIRAGDIVLLWFDYGDHHFPSQKFIDEFPGVSWDGAEYLAKKGVVNIGTDCAGLDNTLDLQFAGHMVCKKYGLVNTESLANLGPLVNRRFQFFGLPLNIRGGTGSPIRAFAWLPDETTSGGGDDS
jgi:kynurenine formamidase